tara:strand:- start:4623 stop:5357 length:735 start_codon:yes stop_codon:yes gene_type:complete
LIYQSEAIVLNHHKYGNTSLICNLFTEKYGKVNIIAKGARRFKNPNSAILQPCNYIDLIYIFKSTRQIQTLKEASITTSFTKINSNYTKMIYGLTVMDIINKISFHDNPCDIIFRLIKKTLLKFNQTKTENLKLYYIFFQIQLSVYLGYYPSFFHCYKCKKELETGSFNLDIGQLFCLDCSVKKKIDINLEDLKMLKFLMSNHIDCIEKNINLNSLNKVNALLYKFISFHIPEIRKSKLFIDEK